MFRTCQKRITTPVNIRLFDNDTGQYVDLDNKECVKYLGVLIDSHLSWRNHIDYISTKLSKTIGLFTKLRHSVPQHTLITLYWSLIHPYLNYVIIAWGQASKTLLNKLLLLQKLVLRFIFFVNWRDSAVPLFVKANIPPLNIMSCQSVANLVYDVVNENCPKNIRQLFLSIKDIHSMKLALLLMASCTLDHQDWKHNSILSLWRLSEPPLSSGILTLIISVHFSSLTCVRSLTFEVWFLSFTQNTLFIYSPPEKYFRTSFSFFSVSFVNISIISRKLVPIVRSFVQK